MTDRERLFAIDRMEGRGADGRAILIADDDHDVEVEIARAVLGADAVEGAVFRVPVRAGGLDWSEARRDRAEEKRRLDWAAAETKRLRARDPGGDLKL